MRRICGLAVISVHFPAGDVVLLVICRRSRRLVILTSHRQRCVLIGTHFLLTDFGRNITPEMDARRGWERALCASILLLRTCSYVIRDNATSDGRTCSPRCWSPAARAITCCHHEENAPSITCHMCIDGLNARTINQVRSAYLVYHVSVFRD